MKRKQNRSAKALAISTAVVVALVGISVFSLYSLANQKKEAGIQAGTIAQAEDASAVVGKLMVQEETVTEASFEAAAPADDEVIYIPDVIVEYVEEEAPAEIIQVDEELVVVSSVVEFKEAAVEESVYDVIQDVQIIEEPVALAVLNTAPVVEEPVYEEPVYEEPVYEEPVYEEPVYEEPVYEEPVYEEPVYEEPAYEEPVYEEPVYEEPAYEEPASEEPVRTRTVVNQASSLGQQIVDYASSYVGVTPYVWAGRSLETGTDCSGFVNLIYDNFGYYASAASDDYQYDTGSWGTQISYDELMPGDVIVYRDGGHVGIYAGQDEYGNEIVIHESNEIDGVKVSDMFYSDPTAYVRILDDEDAYYYAEDDYWDEEYDEEDEYYSNDSWEDDDYYYDEDYEDEYDY